MQVAMRTGILTLFHDDEERESMIAGVMRQPDDLDLRSPVVFDFEAIYESEYDDEPKYRIGQHTFVEDTTKYVDEWQRLVAQFEEDGCQCGSCGVHLEAFSYSLN